MVLDTHIFTTFRPGSFLCIICFIFWPLEPIVGSTSKNYTIDFISDISRSTVNNVGILGHHFSDITTSCGDILNLERRLKSKYWMVKVSLGVQL